MPLPTYATFYSRLSSYLPIGTCFAIYPLILGIGNTFQALVKPWTSGRYLDCTYVLDVDSVIWLPSDLRIPTTPSYPFRLYSVQNAGSGECGSMNKNVFL
jgi:hypothetical protein